jgi:hypothetical protein
MEKAPPPVPEHDLVWIPSHRQTCERAALKEAAAVVVVAFACLLGVILWLDNAQGGLTGNGIFKSLQLKPWVVAPATADLDPSNYLFFPAYGVLCRLLDLLGIWTGDPRRQMTVLNAASGALGAAIFYLLVRRLTARRDAALVAAVFHLGCAFVLFLAIVNEDIMASYTLLLASMALAGVWFAAPTARRVAVVAVLFTIAWLFEWRLLFPTLPAMLAALWLCEPRPRQRFAWIGLFLAVMLATVCLVALAWHGHRGAVGPLGLLYTGKGVDSVWSGFTWKKVWWLWEGIASYLLGTGLTHIPVIGWDLWRSLSSLSVLAIAVVALDALWRGRDDAQGRALAAVFGGTFLAGEVFNLYSQPNDAQMQLTVMPWLPIGWALVLIVAGARWPRRGFVALAGLTAVMVVHNIASLAPERGSDSRWAASVRLIEREADPDRTVFVLHGFDWTMLYLSLHWGRTNDSVFRVRVAPDSSLRFKWIGLINSVLDTPKLTPEEHAGALRRQIERAFDLGYDVIVSDIWTWQIGQLEKSSSTVADKATVAALYQALHGYQAEPAFTDPSTGPYFRLRRPAR